MRIVIFVILLINLFLPKVYANDGSFIVLKINDQIITNIDLKKGKILKDTHIIGLRPLVGISILNKKKIVNRTLKRNIAVGEIIKYRDIK